MTIAKLDEIIVKIATAFRVMEIDSAHRDETDELERALTLARELRRDAVEVRVESTVAYRACSCAKAKGWHADTDCGHVEGSPAVLILDRSQP